MTTGFGIMDSTWLFIIAMNVAFGTWHLGRIADALEKRK